MLHNIFDSHAHYDDSRFDEDRGELLRSIPGAGVSYIINAASDIPSAEVGIGLAEEHDFVFCSVGIHPHEAKDAPADLEDILTELARHPKVCALGEMGLDYHYDFSPREKQREVFERQLSLAAALELPVIVHDREAHGDTMNLLRRFRPRGIVHCYSGSAEMAKEILALGMYIGFTGVVTFKNARKTLEAVAAVPLDRLLLETDCPYMAPEPYRGKRCDSSMIAQTAAAIARVKGIEVQALLDITCENARTVYKITV